MGCVCVWEVKWDAERYCSCATAICSMPCGVGADPLQLICSPPATGLPKVFFPAQSLEWEDGREVGSPASKSPGSVHSGEVVVR